MAEHGTRGDPRDRPISELMRDLADQTTSLVRKEFELAKLELSEKGRKAGMGAGMFAAAALFGAGAFATLTTCLIRLLDTVVAAWLSALILTVVYAAIAAAVALRGKKQVQQATPPMPARAVDSTKEDVEWIKTRARSGRGE
ncbi:MAG TPA: phage holin family protein [Solirubrobacteraceae bacterium]|nr:phage holin family protein [Solirubrobacteraceae bacterium]